MRVLVIEDNGPTLEMLGCLFRAAGHEVAEAANGLAGLTRVAVAVPDVVLCDVCMPGMDGVEFVAALRRLPGCAAVPVVVLTAMPGHLLDGLAEAGGVVLLGKPAEPGRILEVVEAAAGAAGR